MYKGRWGGCQCCRRQANFIEQTVGSAQTPVPGRLESWLAESQSWLAISCPLTPCWMNADRYELSKAKTFFFSPPKKKTEGLFWMSLEKEVTLCCWNWGFSKVHLQYGCSILPERSEQRSFRWTLAHLLVSYKKKPFKSYLFYNLTIII